MNATTDQGLLDTMALEAAITVSCQRVAPNWPLDQLIAVNPWWGWRRRPIQEAAAELARLQGARVLPARSLAAHWWARGAFTRVDIEAAVQERGSALGPDQVVQWMHRADDQPARLPLVVDLADRRRDLVHAMSWEAFVTHHVSQQCAAYFDSHQQAWRPATGRGLYAAWRAFAQDDPSPSLLMGDAGVRQRLRGLPATADAVLQQALPALGFGARDPVSIQAYCTALLGSIGGWAASAAYRGWQAALKGGEDPHLRELLAIRLAWDWVLAPSGMPDAEWLASWAAPAPALDEEAWIVQDAMERAMHQPLAHQLKQSMGRAAPAAGTDVLAVFCIDVRSEPFRRSLEAASPRVRTSGFAGFFGLPLAYTPLGADEARPQLPGLLAPQRHAVDEHDDIPLGQQLAAQQRSRFAWRELWDGFRGTPGSAFTFVEACGWTASRALVQKTLGGTDAVPDQAPLLRPRLQALPGADAAQELAARADMLAGVLRAMGLADPAMQWPSLVLLAGHGSRSANNPFAAGLDCGACGGQSGEVNARVLAQLLNTPQLRPELAARGISIPPGTSFVPGLHCTTTDDVALHDTDLLPARSAPLLAELRAWLDTAADSTRRKRAGSLGLPQLRTVDLAREVRERSTDWAQVRPEWALVNNMAFIAAPRARTWHLDLDGRAFLHDYDWRRDQGFGVLELVMTAPMVVANWINLQYHASCVDPARYGSGNKVLHNVVGGRIGVFEGNGGDLRIGLPMQSVHDGRQWMHAPLRLAVYIEAPPAAIDGVLGRHEAVRQLVDHGWLHLYCLDQDSEAALRRVGGQWIDAANQG